MDTNRIVRRVDLVRIQNKITGEELFTLKDEGSGEVLKNHRYEVSSRDYAQRKGWVIVAEETL